MINWYNKWKDEKHEFKKKLFFEKLDKKLNYNPKSILDIGCGFAFESAFFQEKYNSELYLLDGEAEDNKRYGKFGDTESFGFYNSIDNLKKNWNDRGLIYTFVDAKNINIDKNKKFDLIYSFKSCGFHYPLDTYLDLIKKHSNKKTKLIFDLRKRNFKDQLKNFKVINILHEDNSKFTVQLELK